MTPVPSLAPALDLAPSTRDDAQHLNAPTHPPHSPLMAAAGSAAFNEWLHASLTRLAADVRRSLPKNFVALIIGGGYGRGDGAVVREDGREYPYNDLDLVLVVRHLSRVDHRALDAVSREHERRLKVHVEFSRPLTERAIRHWPHRLLWHDLLYGHHVLDGPLDIVRRNAPGHVALPPPVLEASRLLLNRGAGLLRALRVARGLEQAPDPDFVYRNAAKCAQALGDALLIGSGRYTPGMDQRPARLREVLGNPRWRELADVDRWYAEALAFRAAPDRAGRDLARPLRLAALARAWVDVFLSIESLRTGQTWRSPDAYAAWRGLREADEHGPRRLARNLARNLTCRRLSLRYPRELIYRHLPVLLASPNGRADWADASASLLAVWARVH